MSRARATAALTAVLLAGCTHHAPPEPQIHYTVGAAYQARGVWHYPEESVRYDKTGLGVVEASAPRLTADGERYDPDAMAGAHRTLPLPSVARVTDLDTGHQVLVRLNDRGPDDPGRLIALTPRAAFLLGIPPGGEARVRVQLEVGPSETLRDALGAGPKGAAAPVGIVTAEALPPPGSLTPLGPARIVGDARAAPSAPVPPDRLPSTATEGIPQPGALWLDLGDFQDRTYAEQRRFRLARLGVRVERDGDGRAARYRVRAGPFATVREADKAMDQALRAGVFDARITAQRDIGQ